MVIQTPSKNRFRRVIWGSVILAVLILLLINCIFFFRYKPIVDKTIKKLVQDQSKGLYSIQFNSSSSQILLGKIVLNEVVIQPNFQKMRGLFRNKTLPCRIFMVRIKNIEVYFTDLIQIIWNKNLDIHLVKLIEPNFSIILSPKPCGIEKYNTNSPQAKTKTKIKSLKIDQFLVQEGKIQVYTPNFPGRRIAFSGSNIHLEASSIFWTDSNSVNGSILKAIQFIPFSMIMNNAQWISTKGDYRVFSNRIYYSNREGIMELGNCQGKILNMKIGKQDSTIHKGIEFNLKYIALNHFNWPALLLGESFQVDSVQIHSGDLEIHDEHKPPQSKIYRPLPQEWMEQVTLPVNVKNIDFKDLDIHYKETNPESEKTGMMDFLHSNGEVHNILNPIGKITQADSIRIQMVSQFYGKGILKIHMSFDLLSPERYFMVHAEMSQFPLNYVNYMTLPLAGIKVTGGMMSFLDFSMLGNKIKSKGRVRALYKNLRMKFLVQSQERNPKKIKALSSLANTFLILNDNPLSGEGERKSSYKFSRNTSRSFFNYLWKSLFTGLKPILGITPGREKSIYTFIHELHHYQKWDRELKPGRIENRRIRRQKRILKRLAKGLKNGILNTY